ncbi:MAG: hypothetical protein JNM46_03185 [Anaerolineales bacterium]|nr:hypothetical protein [Anaerolineales bacterium]
MFKNLFGKKNSPNVEKFIKSMEIDYAKYHNGDGYDLNVLKELNAEELKQVESILIPRKDKDWRDVTALAAINTSTALEAVKKCLESPNLEVRIFAAKFLKEKNIIDRVEEVLLKTLPIVKVGGGLVQALALAKEYPTEKVKQKLIWCALHGPDVTRTHCAAMALFLYGKAESEFDNNQKIIFSFNPPDKAKRLEAFPELCQIISVNPNDFMN